MLFALKEFDDATAAGLLARTAVSLEDTFNPDARPVIPGEDEIRKEILAELQSRLQISGDSIEPDSRESLLDALDDEAGGLAKSLNEVTILEALSNKGRLPSDLFQVEIIPNIVRFFGRRFDQERSFIQETVRRPDREQHYGESDSAGGPSLISLFAKRIESRYRFQSFTLLVVGQRRGLHLDVHQAWRLYPDEIDVDSAETLVDALRVFSERFGAEFEVGGLRGSFILQANIPEGVKSPQKINVKAPKRLEGAGKLRTVTLSWFNQAAREPGKLLASLVVGVDLDLYKKSLILHGWRP